MRDPRFHGNQPPLSRRIWRTTRVRDLLDWPGKGKPSCLDGTYEVFLAKLGKSMLYCDIP